MNKIFIIIPLLITVNVLNSQPSMEWMSIVKNPIIDIYAIEVPSIDMESDSEGNVYVSFYDSADGDYQHRIIKYDVFGSALWTYSKTVQILRATTHLKLVENNIFCAYQDYSNCRLVRLDNNGNVLYEKAHLANYITSFEADRRGNIYFTIRGTVNNHFRTVKYDSRGTLKWDVGYNISAEDFPLSLALDNDFNVYVTGTTVGQGPNGLHADMLTVKYNSNGSLKWASIYNSPLDYYDLTKLITCDSNGDIIVVGWSYNNGNSEYITIKYSPATGNPIWQETYNALSCFPRTLATDNQNNVYISGSSFYNSPTVKYSSNGTLLWASVFPGPRAEDMVVDAEQNVYITGSTLSVGYEPSDSYTWKYDSGGNLLWDIRLDRGGNDYSLQISLGHYQVFVMGYSQNGFGLPYVTYTSKYYEPGLRPSEEITTENTSSQMPSIFKLYNNYPNPFNPSTKIRFDIPAGNARLVKLTVYDMLGRQINELVNQSMQPGSYELDFDGSNLASGVYFYRIYAGEFTDLKKMILVK